MISSIVAIWTSISLLYWLHFVPAFRTAMIVSIIISFLILLGLNLGLARFFDTHLNEIAPTYYRLRTSTLVAAALSVLLFCLIVSVESFPPFVRSFFAAVDKQPTYSGEHPTLRAIFDYLAYANAASEYGTSVLRRAYDGNAVRLLVLCFISFPTTYGITLGLSAFFVPGNEYRTAFMRQHVFNCRQQGADLGTSDSDTNMSSRIESFLRPVVWIVLCIVLVLFFLQVVAPFVGRLYGANYSVRILERAQQVEKELRDETNRIQSELQQAKAVYEQELQRVRTEYSYQLQRFRDEQGYELQRIRTEQRAEKDGWISDRLGEAAVIIDYRRHDALCSAFATMRVTGSMFAFWYASQSNATRIDFVLGSTTTVQDRLTKVLFSPDPFRYYENMMKMKIELDIAAEDSATIARDNGGKDDRRAELSDDKLAAMESIIHRLKESHYRDAYSVVGEPDTSPLQRFAPRMIINRAAVRRLCREFGEANDRCVDEIEEFVAAMGSITGFEQRWNGTNGVILEEIDKLENNVREREEIPDDCSDM